MKRSFKGFESFYRGYEQDHRIKAQNTMSAKKNYLLVGLVLSSVVFMDLFFWQMRRSLNNPFATMVEKAALAYPEPDDQNEEDLVLALQAQDTDGDGLSDYDEIYLHNTSAYISDTDSDGIDDAQEISAGQDPTCPTGENCDFADPDPALATLEGPSKFEQDSAAALRVALSKAGIPQDQIDLFTDDELLKIYQDVIYTNSYEEPTTEKVDPEDLLCFEQLTAPEIRELLVAAGVDPDLIESIPDEKIQELYLETLGAEMKKAKTP